MPRTSGLGDSSRTPRSHALGEGPGSIFVHAVSPRRHAAGALAECGHPLAAPMPQLTGAAAGADSFEALAGVADSPACQACADALGLTIAPACAPDTRKPKRRTLVDAFSAAGWAKIAALMVAGTMAVGTLARLLAVARR